jgi:hypothetical protein
VWKLSMNIYKHTHGHVYLFSRIFKKYACLHAGRQTGRQAGRQARTRTLLRAPERVGFAAPRSAEREARHVLACVSVIKRSREVEGIG